MNTFLTLFLVLMAGLAAGLVAVFVYLKLKIKLGVKHSFRGVWIILKSIPYFFKKNDAWINPDLKTESWTLVRNGRHNSNSFLAWWKGRFWLAHANSPYHFATPECKIVVWHSADARKWEKSLELRVPGEDIRDPKFAVVNDKLFMYVLKSIDFNPEPYSTAYVFTEDGVSWSEMRDLTKNEGWLFWNPRTFDGEKWYVPAYWFLHGKSILLETEDGMDFNYVSTIHNGKNHLENDRNDETDISFFPDGTMISTQRLEYSDDLHGDKRACTNITTAKPPYKEWREVGKDYTTRLDGPSLFSYKDKVYAVGRYNPIITGREHIGSLFTTKRTSLFLVTENGFVRLSDFPSSGDTSYGGVVLKDGYAYCTYYTNDTTKDWTWIFGMIQPSDIMMVKLPLDCLYEVSKGKLFEHERNQQFKFIKAA